MTGLTRLDPAGPLTSGAIRGPDDDVLRVADVVHAVRRRWKILMACGIAGAVIATTMARRTSPLYEASASLRIEDKQRTLPSFFSHGRDEDIVLTEVEVLRTRALAADAVDSLGLRLALVASPELRRTDVIARAAISPTAVEGRYRLAWRDSNDVVVTRAGSRSPIAKLTPGVPATFDGVTLTLASLVPASHAVQIAIGPRDAMIDATRGAVHVGRVGAQTDVISLRYRDADPTIARSVLETWVGSYLWRRQHVQHTEARSTAALLRAQIDTLKTELAASEDRFRAYRERERVVNPETEATTQVSRLAQLQAERGGVEAERSALASVLAQVKSSASRAHEGDASPYRRMLAFPTLLRNPAVNQMLSSLSEVENQRATLLARRTTADPEVMALSTRVTDIETQIRGLAESYLASLTAQGESVDRQLQSFDQQISQVPRREVEYARLQRHPVVLAQLVQNLESRLKEAQIAEAVEDPSVSVVDPPYVSPRPVGLQRSMAVALGLFVGLLLGAGAVVLRERTDGSVRTRSDVAWASRGPVLGAVPRLSIAVVDDARTRIPWLRRSAPTVDAAPVRAGEDAEVRVHEAVAPALSEQAEAAFTRVFLNVAATRRPPHTGALSLVITSPESGDGKTTSAVNMAMTLARRGIRTVLVDADLRRGGIDVQFGVPRSPGLGEMLCETLPLERALRRVPMAEGGGRDLSIITRGKSRPDAPLMLGSETMRAIHRALSESFQVVIFDTPPTTAGSDAAVLGLAVDGVVLVARANTTPREAVAFAADELRRAGVHVAGTILNDADRREERGYASDSYAHDYAVT